MGVHAEEAQPAGAGTHIAGALLLPALPAEDADARTPLLLLPLPPARTPSVHLGADPWGAGEARA